MARKSSTSARKTRPGARDTRRTGRTVKETDATVPMKPVRQSSEAKRPVSAAALDQRRQIVGTDDPKGVARRRD